MRVVSLNVNGIRAAHKKGLCAWITERDPDVLCLQEVRARIDQIPNGAIPTEYSKHHTIAEKAGYSGVSIASKKAPLAVHHEMGIPELDKEGRYLRVDFNNVSIVSLYIPSGSSGDLRQEFKFSALEAIYRHLEELAENGRELIICGDYNIAHKKIDIRNWRSNQKNSGFLPEEREWMDRLIDQAGFVDAFRVKNTEPDEYSWWSNRGKARQNNVGWRLDYQMITPALKSRVRSVEIDRQKLLSDHAPVVVDYHLAL